LIKAKVKRQIKAILFYHLSFFHVLMKFKDIDKIEFAIFRNALMNENINI
jgi:hypothetical protein